jgi:hypothetical protein
MVDEAELLSIHGSYTRAAYHPHPVATGRRPPLVSPCIFRVPDVADVRDVGWQDIRLTTAGRAGISGLKSYTWPASQGGTLPPRTFRPKVLITRGFSPDLWAVRSCTMNRAAAFRRAMHRARVPIHRAALGAMWECGCRSGTCLVGGSTP